MRFQVLVCSSLCSLLVLAAAPAAAQHHTAVTPDALRWGPAPDALPPGAQLAVLDGDPSVEGLFSMRLKVPDGYHVAPHWHPNDEHIVVVQGAMLLGVGETVDKASMRELRAGSFARLPGKSPHYVTARGETILHIYGRGPFTLTYLKASDDPRQKTQD